MNEITHYEAIGVISTASTADMKRAYRKALRESHPDTGGSAEAFLRVQEAWIVLGNLSKRRAYDASSKVTTFGGSAPIPENYRGSWGNSGRVGNKPTKSAFWDSYSDDTVNFYKDQNARFAKAKERQEEYLNTPDEEDSPQESALSEVINSSWLKPTLLGISILNITVLLAIAGMPDALLPTLKIILVADFFLFIAILLISVVSVKRRRKDNIVG